MNRSFVLVAFALGLVAGCSSGASSPGAVAGVDGSAPAVATDGGDDPTPPELDSGKAPDVDPMATPGCGAAAEGDVLVEEHFDGLTAPSDNGWKVRNTNPAGVSLGAAGTNKWLAIDSPVSDPDGAGIFRLPPKHVFDATSTLTLDFDVAILAGSQQAGADKSTTDLVSYHLGNTTLTYRLGPDGTPALHVLDQGPGVNMPETIGLDRLDDRAHCVRIAVTAASRKVKVSVDGVLSRDTTVPSMTFVAPLTYDFEIGVRKSGGARPATKVRLDNVVLKIK